MVDHKFLLKTIKKYENELELLFDKAGYFPEDGMKNLEKIKEKHLILWEDIVSLSNSVNRLKDKLK
jgi:hypothetical protein